MKNIWRPLPLCLLLLCGCAHHYVITLDNGRRISTASKPRLTSGQYVFKDALGQPIAVPASRVREIAPASMVPEQKPMFNPQPNSK